MKPKTVHDAGHSIPCHYCDRRALMIVSGEPRCDWHLGTRLPGSVLRRDRSMRRVTKVRDGR